MKLVHYVWVSLNQLRINYKLELLIYFDIRFHKQCIIYNEIVKNEVKNKITLL